MLSRSITDGPRPVYHYCVALLGAVDAASATINTTFYGGTWTERGSCTWGNETILALLAAVDPTRTKLHSTNRQLDVHGYPFGFSTGGTSPVDLTTMQAKVRPQFTAHGYPADTKIYVNGYNREYVGSPICNTDDGCSPPFFGVKFTAAEAGVRTDRQRHLRAPQHADGDVHQPLGRDGLG